MGSQQILLYILGVLIILVVVGTAYLLFQEFLISSNKDAIVADLQSLAGQAEQYAMKPAGAGGGGGSFNGFSISPGFARNDNALYTAGFRRHGQGIGWAWGRPSADRGRLTLIGTSTAGYGTVTMIIDDSAAVTSLDFTGNFH